MGNRNPIRQGLAVAVILLFIGVTIAPSINASVVKDELVEFDVEFCGLGKKHTVQLTQEEADEVELLFDYIEQRLFEVETREEAEIIFKDAVVELDKYGLLGGMSIGQAQKLVTRKYQDEKVIEFLERNPDVLDDNENLFCLIAGNVDNTLFGDIFSLLFTGIAAINFIFWATIMLLMPDNIQSLLYEIFPRLGDFLSYSVLLPVIWSFGKPVNFGGLISFGSVFGYPDPPHTIYYPSTGWVVAIGYKGINKWTDSFYGHLSPFQISSPFFVGATGFTGFKFSTSDGLFFLGTALHIKLDSGPP